MDYADEIAIFYYICHMASKNDHNWETVFINLDVQQG